MKTNKILAILATAASIVALVSCQKEETLTDVQGNGISTITLTIEQPTDEDAAKTVLGEGTGSPATYPINWSTGDKIAVSAQSGSTFNEYTLSAGEGSTSGTFTGTSVSGAVYAYYPYSGVKSVSTTTYTVNIPAQQTYVANSFGEGALPMYGVASSTTDLKTLTPLMSVLKLPLKGSCKVSRIEVSSASQNLSGTGTVTFTESTASMTVTGNKYVKLICSTAVQLNESTATLFHIAIPASAEGTYTVKIITDESKVLSKTLTVAKAFTAGKMKKTPELTGVAPTTIIQYTEGSYCGDAITVAGYTWAPVNCGYDATNYKYGKLYQWGRAVGGGYNKSGDANNDAGGEYQIKESSATVSSTTPKTNPTDNVFYLGKSSDFDWYINTSDNTKRLQSWPMKSGDSGYVEGKIANPCPSGWRVPTYEELNALTGNSGSTSIGTGGWDSTKKGYWFNGTTSPSSGSGLFLPAAGYRSSNGTASSRGTHGYYWSSSPYSDAYQAQNLYFNSTSQARMYGNKRAYGYSVRCVQD